MSYGQKEPAWKFVLAGLAIAIPFGIYFIYCLSIWFP